MKNITPIFTAEQIASKFSVPVENVKRQFAANAINLEKMHTKAVDTGKKVNGYTAEQLAEAVEFYKKSAI